MRAATRRMFATPTETGKCAEHRLVVRRVADEQDAPRRALGVDAELGVEQPARHRELVVGRRTSR